VVTPELRARAHGERRLADPSDPDGAVRPSEAVTDAPATYAQLDRLPPPRRLGDREDEASRAPEGRPPPGQPRAPGAQAAGRSGRIGAEARGSALFVPGPSAPTPASTGQDAPTRPRPPAAEGDIYNPHRLTPPLSPFEIKAGSVIPAVLLSGVDTVRAGPVVAAVTENVYDSVSGRYLLVPQGARLIGRQTGESRHGDRRAFLVWTRLLLPDGKSLVLTDEAAVDAQGTVGVGGRVDRQLGPLAIATLFAGAITTLGQAARDHDRGDAGLLGDAGDAAAIEAAQVGGRLIGRELDVRPSIRLDPGARVRVLVTRDLVLEPYAP
jgi:type IV secretion system protein VirB10